MGSHCSAHPSPPSPPPPSRNSAVCSPSSTCSRTEGRAASKAAALRRGRRTGRARSWPGRVETMDAWWIDGGRWGCSGGRGGWWEWRWGGCECPAAVNAAASATAAAAAVSAASEAPASSVCTTIPNKVSRATVDKESSVMVKVAEGWRASDSKDAMMRRGSCGGSGNVARSIASSTSSAILLQEDSVSSSTWSSSAAFPAAAAALAAAAAMVAEAAAEAAAEAEVGTKASCCKLSGC